MKVVVFVGPSLPAEAVLAQLNARVLPPAAMGDILRAARGGPPAIALIDGIFDGVLPVWHKEILWAMAQGIHVFGGASMGALRAAELDGFGMRGVGRIYDAYSSGELEADDEVAVLHGPPEVGYAAVTEALVNVRATLERATREGILAAEEAAALLGRARSLHYRDRTWDEVLASMEAGAAARLRSWLPGGRVDLKRADAVALLTELAAFLRSAPAPMEVDYRFARTDAFDALYRRVAMGRDTEDVLDELRLRPTRFRAVRRAALLRVLAGRELERSDNAPAEARLAEAVERLRSRLGLWRRADLNRWLAQSELDERGFHELAREEALLAQLEEDAGNALASAMLAELRLSGEHAGLALRARQKTEQLAAAGLDGPTGADIDLAPLLARLAAAFDGPTADLERELGFADRSALNRAALREVLFQRIFAASQGEDSARSSARSDSS